MPNQNVSPWGNPQMPVQNQSAFVGSMMGPGQYQNQVPTPTMATPQPAMSDMQSLAAQIQALQTQLLQNQNGSGQGFNNVQ